MSVAPLYVSKKKSRRHIGREREGMPRARRRSDKLCDYNQSVLLVSNSSSRNPVISTSLGVSVVAGSAATIGSVSGKSLGLDS